MPEEFIPQTGPETSNITQCIGGGNLILNFGQSYLPTASRDFTNSPIYSPSPIPVQEIINIDGDNQYNCSLINRVLQAKGVISQESFLNGTHPFVPTPHIYYGDGQTPIITDYVPPTIGSINAQSLNVTLSIPATNQLANVYESAYFAEDDIVNHGANLLNSIQVTPTTFDDTESFLFGFDTYPPGTGIRWVIKNQNSNHQDWTYYHSATPNPLEYTVFTEDHWWIYDFGEDNKQIVGKIDIMFLFTDVHRHSHIEVSGSNVSDIFSTNPNVENIVGEQWKGLGTLNNGSFPSNGILSAEIPNQTAYRWYKLTFKSDGFEDDELHLQNIEFYPVNLPSVNEVKMSDFYGLFLIETLLDPGPPLNVVYNSGYRMIVTSSENNPQLNLGGGPP